MSQKSFRNISIDIETYDRLRRYGEGPPDSFNRIINRMLDEKEKRRGNKITAGETA